VNSNVIQQVGNDVIEKVVHEIVERAIDLNATNIRDVLRREQIVVTDRQFDEIYVAVQQQLQGYGPLSPLFIRGVTDVLVMPDQSVWIDDSSGLHLTGVTVQSDSHARQLAVRLAQLAHRRLDDAHPWVDAQLPDGNRLHAILSPTSAMGTAISIRVPLSRPLPLEQLLEQQPNQTEMLCKLRQMLSRGDSFIVSGATGAGKTTLLRSLLIEAQVTQRIVTIEDVAEINIQRPNIISLQGRVANVEGAGHISLRDLVRQSLRMRPDRIVVGELRGPEALDWLLAVSSGHSGSATTVHAHSARDVFTRLELLCSLSGTNSDVTTSIMKSSIDAIVHCQRVNNLRQITEIWDREQVLQHLTMTRL
jgi:pilus assembly protein CpaF